MTLLNLLPNGVKLSLMVRVLTYAFSELESKHVGKLLNTYMDERAGSTISNPIQKKLARWLRQVAEEVEA